MIATVAPPRSTKEETSALLTTSPCSWAWSSRLCVGSSVFWLSSRSSAMALLEGAHLVRVEIEEQRHQRAEQEHEKEESRHDVDRHGEKEDLKLRHQPCEHAQRRINRKTENQKRRGKLEPQREGARDDADGQLGHVAGGQRRAGRNERIAALDCADRQMMQVGGENQNCAHQREEVAHDGGL